MKKNKINQKEEVLETSDDDEIFGTEESEKKADEIDKISEEDEY